jgi:Fur family ferric uptake transcriptional regulator
MPHEAEHRALSRYLEDHHLRATKQREEILDCFLQLRGHITSEELYRRVRERAPHIGFTTVYRTMKLLCEAGLVTEREFGGGVTRYEIANEHHDHLVCLRCGKIVEFECSMIESTQMQIAERYGFRVLRHRHELYGHCDACRALLAAEAEKAE